MTTRSGRVFRVIADSSASATGATAPYPGSSAPTAAGAPVQRPWLAAMLAGIVSAVKHGRVGNSAWGRSMFGKRGGQVMARHALHHLRAVAPMGARASVIARGRRKAREA